MQGNIPFAVERYIIGRGCQGVDEGKARRLRDVGGKGEGRCRCVNRLGCRDSQFAWMDLHV